MPRVLSGAQLPFNPRQNTDDDDEQETELEVPAAPSAPRVPPPPWKRAVGFAVGGLVATSEFFAKCVRAFVLVVLLLAVTLAFLALAATWFVHARHCWW